MPKLITIQREYLLYINTLDSLWRRTVIEGAAKKFAEILSTQPGLVTVAEAHAEFLNKIVTECFLNQNGERMLEPLFASLCCAIEFGHSCSNLEKSMLIGEENLEDRIAEEVFKIQRNLKLYRHHVTKLLTLFYKYHKMGIEISRKRLCLTIRNRIAHLHQFQRFLPRRKW